MILLDTQAWLRLAAEPDRLSAKAASAIRRGQRSDGIGISVFSFWEAAWLHRRQKIRSRLGLRDWLARLLEATAVKVESLTPEICATAAELPYDLPFDPGDRLIAATAIVLGCPLVTSDARLLASRAVHTIW